jgi:CDP-diacylglycerol--serine O-phosphatidyltransferase
MGVKSHIPNILTLANLFCGILAIKVGFSEHYYLAGFFVLLGAFFDFFDGFSARLLKVQGELGKQLDSFADMVTFGVAPGVVMYSFLSSFIEDSYIPYISFVIPLLSALRLAKFNIDSNQSGKFIGLPTPANALFFVFIPLVFIFESFGWDNTTFVTQSLSVSETFKYLMIVIILLFSYLLNAPIEMIALKFNSFGWKGNEIRFVFLGLCLVVISLSLLISSVFVSVPIIILLYIILSIINNLFKKKQNELQS